jgi:hypothetical protein
VNDILLEDGIIGGLSLDRWGEDPHLMLFGFGDENTAQQIDELVESLGRI